MSACLKCHTYYSLEQQNNLCSHCYVTDDENVACAVVAIDDQNLAQLSADLELQKDIGTNLTTLFNDFCQRYALKFTTVTDNQFALLAAKLSTLSSGEITAHLRGLRDDFPALAMTAKQACQLLALCKQRLCFLHTTESEESVQHKQYAYVHAICPYVLDPWNIGKWSITLGGGNWASLVECY